MRIVVPVFNTEKFLPNCLDSIRNQQFRDFEVILVDDGSTDGSSAIAAVCIRTSTERPEALEAGDFILAGITTRELLNATDMAIEMKQKGVLGKNKLRYELLSDIFTQMVNVGTKIWGHFDLKDADASVAVSKTNVPILIIHGDKDNRAPLSMAYKIYDSWMYICPILPVILENIYYIVYI